MFGFSKRDAAAAAAVAGVRKTSTAKRVITFASAAAVVAAGVTTVGVVSSSAANAASPGDVKDGVYPNWASPYTFALTQGTGTQGQFDISQLNVAASIDGFAAYCVEPYQDAATDAGTYTVLDSGTAELKGANNTTYTPTLQQWALWTYLLNEGPQIPVDTATEDEKMQILAKQAVIWTITENPEMLSTPEGIAAIQGAVNFNGTGDGVDAIRGYVATYAADAWKYWSETIKPVFADKTQAAGTGIYATPVAAEAKPVTITDFPQGTSINLGLGDHMVADGSTLTGGLTLSADGTQINIPAATAEGTYKIRVGIAAPALWSFTDDRNWQVVATPKGPTINYIDQYITVKRAPQVASLGDTVWEDTNKDGLQTAGEPGVADVTVKLLDATGAVVATKTTDANGKYLFENLTPGDYSVEFVAPTGKVFTTANSGTDDATDSDADVTTGKTGVYTLKAGDNNLTVDAGIVTPPPAPAALGDFVWQDTNKNGLQDAGEAPVAGVVVNLLDATGKQIATTTTDAEGKYLFDNLAAGTYSVEFKAPAGTSLTTANAGDDAKDSDADVATGKTGQYTLAAGDRNLTVDAGLVTLPASLGDTVWLDTNKDGIQDAGEPGVAGVVVNLLDKDGKVVATDTTDANGKYLFENLAPGDYVVEFKAPAGTKLTTANVGDDAKDSDADATTGKTAVVSLKAGDNNLTVDAGVVALPAALGDFVWQDTNKNGLQDAGEAPVAGVVVNLLDATGAQIATTTTDAEGKYLFDNLAAGTYSVEFKAPAGTALTTANAGDDAKDSDADVATGKTGQYTLAAGDRNLTVDAGLVVVPATLGDTVWLDTNKDGIQDAGEPGVAGVVVNLLDKDGKVVATDTTDENGKYLFENLAPGDYVVEFKAPAGTKLTTANVGDDAKDSDADATTGKTAVVSLKAGDNNLTVDAGVVPLPAALGDFVWLDANKNGVQDAGEAPVADVVVNLLDKDGKQIATTKTDAAGKYIFENLAAGTYSVQFVAPADKQLTVANTGDDAADSDADVATGKTGQYTLAAGDRNLTVDAGLFVKPASLGDTVWLDANKDGIQGPDEKGVANVTVNLLDKDGKVVATETTDENGKYLFENVTPGDYTVEFKAPEGTQFTTPNVGDDTKDSDADATTGKTGVITLAPGDNNLTVDAGVAPIPAALGDFVWLDTNKNGVQEAGEAPVAGVVVNLLDATGKQIATTTTDAAGKYLFDGLAAGTYSVQFVAPADKEFTLANNGTDDAKDSDADVATGTTGTYTLKAGDRNLTVDAGLVLKPASLGDTVWLDSNSNGVQDAGEPGVKDVTVNLLDENGNLVAITTTDDQGHYEFTDLGPGEYVVEFVAPEGTKFTTPNTGDDTKDSDADLTSGKSAPVVLKAGDNNTTIDAGVVPLPAALGDLVWLDANKNGVQDAGEAPVAGVVVNLLDKDGKQVATTTTDAAGKYIFENLAAGTYSVQFVAPADKQLTLANAGGDDAKDSDADVATGKTGQYTLKAGDRNLTVDAGLFVKPASLGDTVWLDSNNNGVQDAGEPGVPGVTVNLLDKDGKVVATTTTDASGNYEFKDLVPGTYVVEFVAPERTKFTTPNSGDDTKDSDADLTTGKSAPIVLNPGDNNTTIDAGVVPLPAALGDYVWEDKNGNGIQDAGEKPVADVVVNLLDKDGKVVATTKTDATGKYLFDGLAAGTYSVEFVAPAGMKITKANAGDDATDSDADATTGKTGTYTLLAGDRNLTVDAGLYKPGSIGDTVWNDTNGNGEQDPGEPGVPGVTVNLLDEDGKVIKTTTTDEEGNYKFTDLPPGTYIVEVVTPPGTNITPPNKGTDDTKDSDADVVTGKTPPVTIDSGDEDVTVDVGLVKTATLGDTVWEDLNADGIQDAGEPGVANVVVNLLDKDGKVVATTKTDDKGNYLFTGLQPGDYIVEFVAPEGSTITKTNVGDDAADSDADATTGKTAVISLKSGDKNLTVDAGIVKPASIGDYVWQDNNGNGIQDAGEPGVPNVVVNLLDKDGKVVATTKTDADGKYEFTNLTPGDYIVEFVPPANQEITTPGKGTDRGTDSNANVTTGRTDVVTVKSGEDNKTIDAGVLPVPAKIGDTVWNDTNGNGTQDPGEPGVPNVTVNLKDENGNVVDTTTTDSEGKYEFDKVLPGTYVVEFIPPSGTKFTTPDQGDDTKDSDVDIKTGTTKPITVKPGDEDLTVDAGLVTPALDTTAADTADGDKMINVGSSITDKVDFKGLTPGVEYVMSGELFDKATGKSIGVSAAAKFTPTTANGSTNLEFALPAEARGLTLVVFESVYVAADVTIGADGAVVVAAGKTPEAIHHDINDADQTVSVPDLDTTATDNADADKVVNGSAANATVRDIVTYTGLTPGVEYVLAGELMNKATGAAVAGTQAVARFTPTAADGSVQILLPVPSTTAANIDMVAFQSLYLASDVTATATTVTVGEGKTAVAEHRDINSAAQTVRNTPSGTEGNVITTPPVTNPPVTTPPVTTPPVTNPPVTVPPTTPSGNYTPPVIVETPGVPTTPWTPTVPQTPTPQTPITTTPYVPIASGTLPSTLARTGSNGAAMGITVALLLAAGGALMVAGRRRKSEQDA